jgi:hypothetical protein
MVMWSQISSARSLFSAEGSEWGGAAGEHGSLATTGPRGVRSTQERRLRTLRAPPVERGRSEITAHHEVVRCSTSASRRPQDPSDGDDNHQWGGSDEGSPGSIDQGAEGGLNCDEGDASASP